MAAPHSSLLVDKASARARALTVRSGCDPRWGAALMRVAGRWPAPGVIVAGFWPLEGEIDTRPLLHAWHNLGHMVVLPRTSGRGQPLTFHHWEPGMRMHPGAFGTLSPAGPAVEPGALLVPLLAYDRAGHRLGYGAGYYDRTLAGLPGRPTLGAAFAAQRVACVPAGPHDVRLDAVATERGVERFNQETH